MRRHIAPPMIAVVLGLAPSVLAQQLSIVTDLPGGFIDISVTGGVPLNLGNDESIGINTFPGNGVFLAGTIVVSNNGGMGFGSNEITLLAPENETIPSGTAFDAGQAALVFWDDIDDDIDDKNADVFVAQLTGMLIVQWNNLPLVNDPAANVKFQIQVFENVGPEGIVAQYLFADVTAGGGGAGATIGYQDGPAGFNDVQFSFNSPGAVADGTVLSLVLSQQLQQIPTVSTWGLGALAALLLAAGATVLHRRRLKSIA